ncbi:MAG: hypothetical protein U0136_06095 [Bdellovibrionota bacterium]
MSDDQQQLPPPQTQQLTAKENKASQDWDTDKFPTSARPVFVGWGIMVGGIILLCTVVYCISDHPKSKSEAPSDTKKVQAAEHLAGIQDAEDEEE